MKYSEIYRAMGYTVEVFDAPSGGYGWSAQLDGEMDTATHAQNIETEAEAMKRGMDWAKETIDHHSKRR